MSKKQWLLGIVFANFAALNAYAVYQYGYAGVIALVTANMATITVLVDLTIALSLVAVWMWNDARQRGISALPYLVVTLFLGSIGPLLYLLRTSRRDAAVAAPMRLNAGSVR
jgi:hypothetical protein